MAVIMLAFLGAILLLQPLHAQTANIKMGEVNNECDNGKSYIEVDWDPESNKEYTCYSGKIPVARKHSKEFSPTKVRSEIHVCLPQKITYKDAIPVTGAHRPLWPRYGTYLYLPPQRWLHSLEHGAIVFIYDPCADDSEVQKLEKIVRKCLFRHIITPYKMQRDYPLALLTQSRLLLMNHVDAIEAVNFIIRYALKGTENVSSDGQYDKGLLNEAQIISDSDDSCLCPSMQTTTLRQWMRPGSSKKCPQQQ